MTATLAPPQRLTPPAASQRAPVETICELSRRDFDRIAVLLKQDSGIALADNRTALVYSRLAKRLRLLGMTRFGDYCDLIESSEGSGERRAMLSALTTNLTRFYREPHHFEDFQTQVVGRLVGRGRHGAALRFWSSACSTGQEAYSMGLSLLDAFPDAAEHDVRILATDIDPQVLAKACDPDWTTDEIADIPARLRDKWLVRTPQTEAWRPGAALRKVIAFRELNLVGRWPLRARFEAIFCRNVTIYFDEATQSALWGRLCGQLAPGGTLYIGHSERLSVEAMRLMTVEGITTFRSRAEPAR